MAISKLYDAAEGADLLVFVVPHHFIGKLCDEMMGCVSAKARGITLIKVIQFSFVYIAPDHNKYHLKALQRYSDDAS